MITRKMTDRMLLEGLVNKYGKAKITSAINKINENVNGEEYKDLILDILDSEDFGNHIDKNSNYENTHNYGNTWTEEYLTIEEDYIKDNFRFVFPEMKVRYKWCRNRWGREYCDGVSSIKIWTSGMQIYINNEKIKLSRPLITEISKKLKEWIY